MIWNKANGDEDETTQDDVDTLIKIETDKYVNERKEEKKDKRRN